MHYRRDPRQIRLPYRDEELAARKGAPKFVEVGAEEAKQRRDASEIAAAFGLKPRRATDLSDFARSLGASAKPKVARKVPPYGPRRNVKYGRGAAAAVH